VKKTRPGGWIRRRDGELHVLAGCDSWAQERCDRDSSASAKCASAIVACFRERVRRVEQVQEPAVEVRGGQAVGQQDDSGRFGVFCTLRTAGRAVTRAECWVKVRRNIELGKVGRLMSACKAIVGSSWLRAWASGQANSEMCRGLAKVYISMNLQENRPDTLQISRAGPGHALGVDVWPRSAWSRSCRSARPCALRVVPGLVDSMSRASCPPARPARRESWRDHRGGEFHVVASHRIVGLGL